MPPEQEQEQAECGSALLPGATPHSAVQEKEEVPLHRLTDAHCHVIDTLRHQAQPDSDQLLDRAEVSRALAFLRTGRLAVMGTRPQDWDAVAALAAQDPHRILPAFGVHPWHASSLPSMPSADPSAQDSREPSADPPRLSGDFSSPTSARTPEPETWLARLRSHLLAHPHAWVGEIGLDGVATHPITGTLHPWPQQLAVFDAQLRLAHQLRRPVSIHAVRCPGRMVEYFGALAASLITRYGRPAVTSKRATRRQAAAAQGAATKTTAPTPSPADIPCSPAIMLHSFSASPQVVRSLLSLPYVGERLYFSFSHAITPRSPQHGERIAAVPADRVLVESDLHDWRGVDAAMVEGVRMIASARGWTVPETVERLARNLDAFIGSGGGGQGAGAAGKGRKDEQAAG